MTFTASNGAQVILTNAGQTGYVLAQDHERIATAYLDFAQMTAWREHAQHERDEELGRWRPEHPSDYVAYPQADGSVLVVDERSGLAETLYRPGDDRSPILATAGGSATAHAYFKAHPEPKSWDVAKPGEVWAIRPNGLAWVLESGAFMFDDESFIFAKDITDAQKVWPKEES